MRTSTRLALSIGAAVLFAGCGGSQPPIGAGGAMPQISPIRITPDNDKNGVAGVYASEFFAGKINGYKGGDPKNGPPICTLSASYPEGIAVDQKGNLIDADWGTKTIIVYKGPKLCGPKLATISDPFGQPSDVASLDAATGKIVVATPNLSEGSNVAVCSIKRGCYKYLKSPNVYEIAGVALAKNGDCWESHTTSSGRAGLIYFKGCSQSGKAATGWKNNYSAGLDIDTGGNIVAIDWGTPALWIYSGCNPHCTVVGGPFALHGDSLFGHLNRTGTEFVAGDSPNGALDVYKYSTSALTYEYSITNGLSASEDVEGAAFDPGSRQ